MLKKYFALLFFIFLFSHLAFAEEISLTTYYPSPYGNYNNVTTGNLTATNNATLATSLGSRIGIGIVSPLTGEKLTVSGGIRLGGVSAPYVYSNQDANGLYVEQVGTVSATDCKIRLQSSPSGTQLTYAQFFVDPINGFSFMSSAGGSSGRVGIGIATPSAQLHTTGTVRFANFGTGTATFDASGNLISVSDERLKNIQGQFTRGLREIIRINPILYKWNEKSGMDMENVYAGFSAQQVMAYIPEAVGKNKDGYYSFNDRPVIAALVNAIKEQQNQIDNLKQEINQLKERLK